MANSFESWPLPPTSYSQPQLQLEHEYAAYPIDQQQQRPDATEPFNNFHASSSTYPSLMPNAYPRSAADPNINVFQRNMYVPQRQQQQGPYPTYNFQRNAEPDLLAGQFMTASPPMQDHYQLPPVSAQQSRPQMYQQSSTTSPPRTDNATASSAGRPKRPRLPDHHDDESRDDDGEAAEQPAESKDKGNKPGACARCKSLKVRCEFKTDTDPCKRCLNGGHECVIPGRKKRRTPPKREHLINEIRAQAEQIQSLMRKLEEAESAAKSNDNARRRPQGQTAADTISSGGPSSPVLSPSTTHTSFFGSENPTPSSGNPETNKAVEDWLAKAKDSFAEFEGFIGISGASFPKSYIVEEDPEDPPNSDEEWTDGAGDIQDDYEIAVVSDEEGASPTENQPTLRHRPSFASSNGSAAQPKKKDSGASEKLATLPSEAVPFGLIAGMSLRKNKKRGSSEAEMDDPRSEKALGVANEDFFRSSPAPDPRRVLNSGSHGAHILTRGIITPDEAENLFKIYFDTMNLSLSLVDPVLYTAQKTFQRSPFLFTVICALAARFDNRKPEVHNQLMHYAQLAAGTALISGPKNIEVCIAYILLSLYPVPSKRWEDERGWIYLGLAIRIAVDLNLHLPNTAKPQNEHHAREQLNRTRVWLNCFNLDRSTGSQYGKAPIISNLDYTANHSEHWWKSSPYNMEHFDIHLVCYNAELRVMANFISKIYSDRNHPTGLNKDAPFEKLATETDNELQLLGKKWFELLDKTDMTNVQNSFRTGLLKLAYSYSRLVALSFGFQFGKHAVEHDNPFFMRCLAAATDVVNTVVYDVCRPNQRMYYSHGPEAQRVFLTFAAAFLVKLLQPKFASYFTPEKRTEVRNLVQSAIDLLGSPDIAVDDRHGPKLHSRFLQGLLEKVESSSSISSKYPGSRTKSRRPKSASSEPPPSGNDPQYMSSPASTTHSISSPYTAAPSLDQFAGIIDPFAATASQSNGQSGLDINLNMSDFFYPPLPYDSDIMQGMQSLTDPVWQDTLPGFNYLAQFQIPQRQNIYDHNAQYQTTI